MDLIVIILVIIITILTYLLLKKERLLGINIESNNTKKNTLIWKKKFITNYLLIITEKRSEGTVIKSIKSFKLTKIMMEDKIK